LQGSKVSPPRPCRHRRRTVPQHRPCSRPTLTPLKRPSGTSAISRSFTNFTQLLLYKNCDGPAAREWLQEASMSLLARLHRMNAELSEGENDPWRRALERALPASVMSTSTVALLALLDFPATSANARRLARTMRSMGWVGIKSRKLAPGGWRNTECRGWSRPIRGSNRPKDECHVS